MKVKNNSKSTYIHGEYKLLPFGTLEVPKEVANILFKTNNVVEFVEPKDAAKKQAELEDENAKLRAEIEKLKADAAKKQAESQKTLEELKKEADELGVEYPANIGAVKLQERIKAKKAEQQ